MYYFVYSCCTRTPRQTLSMRRWTRKGVGVLGCSRFAATGHLCTVYVHMSARVSAGKSSRCDGAFIYAIATDSNNEDTVVFANLPAQVQNRVVN